MNAKFIIVAQSSCRFEIHQRQPGTTTGTRSVPAYFQGPIAVCDNIDLGESGAA